jgi:hypothetical protein
MAPKATPAAKNLVKFLSVIWFFLLTGHCHEGPRRRHGAVIAADFLAASIVLHQPDAALAHLRAGFEAYLPTGGLAGWGGWGGRGGRQGGRRTLEIFEVRRRLGLLDGHQIAVGADEIAFLADEHVAIVLIAVVFVPERVVFAVQPFVRSVSDPAERAARSCQSAVIRPGRDLLNFSGPKSTYMSQDFVIMGAPGRIGQATVASCLRSRYAKIQDDCLILLHRSYSDALHCCVLLSQGNA